MFDEIFLVSGGYVKVNWSKLIKIRNKDWEIVLILS